MSPAIIGTILVAALVTATISGVFGMAGGLILMGVLTTYLPVASAMVLHGFIQIISNASRAFLLRRRPYELPERLQSRAEAAAARGKAVAGGDDGSGLGGGEADDAPPLMPVWSGQQMRAWLARGVERGVAFAGAVSLARARARGLV